MSRARLHHVGVVPSTNDLAFERIASGAASSGDVYVAEGQTSGRGRLGRLWESPPGEGLYLSLVWSPRAPLEHPAAITMAAGLAVFEAVAGLGARDARLKWPNDVLLGEGAGAKVAGILVETRGEPSGPFVIGAGVNVLQQGFPDELVAERASSGFGVTSLALAGCSTTVAEVLEAVVARLEERLDALAEGRELERDYVRATRLRGQRVRVTRGNETCEGHLEDISLQDGICLRRADGWLSKVPVEHATALIPLS